METVKLVQRLGNSMRERKCFGMMKVRAPTPSQPSQMGVGDMPAHTGLPPLVIMPGNDHP